VIVLIADDATLLCDGAEQREQMIPARYHELKALAHLAFGVQLTLMANGSGRLSELTASELHKKHAQIREAQAAINASRASASSSALISHGIARQRASILESFFTSARAPPLNARIGWSTANVSATSTPRSTCWRDILSISGPRIFYSATGGIFRRIFLPTPPEQ